MKIRIWINVFLFFFIIFLLANLFLEKKDAEKKISLLTNINSDTIDEIYIQRKSLENIIFKKQNEKWSMDFPFKITANAQRIESILEILKVPVYAKFDVDSIDPVQFDLKNPRILLKLNERQLLFGTTNPIDQKRYILFGKNIYIIEDALYPQLMTNPIFFIDNKVLPNEARITSINYPNYNFKINDNTWQSTSTKYSVEQIKKIIYKWESMIAVSISKYEEIETKKRISIKTSSNKQIDFMILATHPYLILGREDLGIQYNIGNDDAKLILDKPDP